MVDLNKLVDSRPIVPLPVAANRKADAREQVKKIQDTAGPAWYNMPKPEMTPELKNDIRALKMRAALDPKRHYKGGTILTSQYFQVGTVIDGPDKYYSSGRLSRKERGNTIVDTLLRDDKKRAYFKKKFAEAQKTSRAGGKLDYRAKQNGIKKPWSRK